MDAIFFTIVASGFRPRSSIESGAQADLRVERILTALNDSPYSVHDLSRSIGEGPENLARFNMPLELGMAIQLRHSQVKSQHPEPHDFFIMTGVHADYGRFASDLRGYDIEPHGEETEALVSRLVEWLQTKRGAASNATKPDILQALPYFLEAKKKKVAAVGRVWKQLVVVATEIAEAHLPAVP